MNKKYNKLVRDKIPDIIKSNGETPITRILSDDEYKIELERKLYEEYNEVMKCLAELENSNLDEVMDIAKTKVKKRGSFNKKIFLEDVK